MRIKVDFAPENKEKDPNKIGTYAIYSKKHWWNKWKVVGTCRYADIAACHNDRCPSHKNCLRWQIGKRNPDIVAGNFAPKGRYSQRCGDWKKGGGV